MAQRPAPDPVQELQTQNTELVASLAELRTRQEELERLNTELEDTNRGVVALYAELDERAEQLRQASELKSRFLSNMSHEFRTPLNSILALSRLLLDRIDGPLTAEQERQVTYIRRSAESLTELVNDLLDLAKVEAGKLEVRPRPFTVTELFGALRGVMKPLQQNDAVDLIFEEPCGLPGAVHRRSQGRADPAQPGLQRAEIHRTRRGPGVRAASTRQTRHCQPGASSIPGSASRRSITIWCSRSSPRSPTGCSSAPRAPAWACRCRAGWRNCWAAALTLRSTPGDGSMFHPDHSQPLSQSPAGATSPATASCPNPGPRARRSADR